MNKQTNNLSFTFLLSLYYKENPLYLSHALNSIRNQILLPNEIVIVYDGPVSLELDSVVQDFRLTVDSKVIIHKLSSNVGLAAALNSGLNLCTSDYIVRCDSDDISIPNRLKVINEFLIKNTDIDIVGSFANIINDESINTGTLIVPTSHTKIYNSLWSCPLIHPSVCFNRLKIINIGGYNKDAGIRQDDYELWYRSALNGLKFSNIPDVLIDYRYTKQTFLKNNIKVGFYRLRIGIKICKLTKPKHIAYIGILYPLIRSFFPLNIQILFSKIFNKSIIYSKQN